MRLLPRGYFYFLEIAFFKREHCTQDNISCCFYDARSISHLKFFCRNLKNLSALVHYHYFSKNIFHFSTVRPGVHDHCSAKRPRNSSGKFKSCQ